MNKPKQKWMKKQEKFTVPSGNNAIREKRR